MGSGGSKKKTEGVKNDAKSKKSPRKVQKQKTNISETFEDLTKKPLKGVRKHQTSYESPKMDSRRNSDQFVPYDAENLVLEGDWEIEKGVDDETFPTDVNYPAPSPPKPFTDFSAYIAVDYQIMKNNIEEPKLAAGTFEEVATHLTRDLKLQILKVRALTTWISLQKIRTRQYGPEAMPDTVLGYMKQIKELQGTFAGLLALLCRAIDIPCVIIKGIYKSNVHDVGLDDVQSSRCTWNAVYVDESWQIVHPFLICTPLSTKTPQKDWKLIESSVNEPDKKSGSVLNTFFFAPKPEEFIYFCFPDESKSPWQLTDTKIEYSTFLKQPYLRPAFFSAGMKLQSEPKCVLLSELGKCNIKIQCQPHNVNDLELMYQLYSPDLVFEKDEEWGDLVLCGRNEDTWNIQIKFPIDGTFKIALFATLNDWFFWIGDFKIICGAGLDHFVPTPAVPKEVGFGPSEVSSDAGLLSPSHEGGIVFYKPKEEHVIKFLIKQKMFLSCDLENTQMETEDLKDYCNVVIRKNEVDFTVRLPFSGDFALRIYRVDELGERHNVCNYLFIDSYDVRKREDLFQRRARSKLREATSGHDIDVLEHAIEKFKQVKLPQDDDYLRGERRLHYLRIRRGLREARMRRHEGTLLKAIEDAEESQFRPALEPNINRARQMLKDIQSIEIHNHPVLEMDQKTIAEIANFANPPSEVHSVMMAVYLLLGEERQFLQKWGNIQSLLRRQGKESIKYRINDFQNQRPSDATVQSVRKLIDSVPDKYSLASSLSAYTFHQWVSNMLAYLQNTSKNAIDPDDTFETEDYELYHVTDDVKAGNGDISKRIEDYNEEISPNKGFLDSPELQGKNLRH